MFEGVLDVKASSGNNQLGGFDFDQAVVGWLVTSFAAQAGVDVRTDARAMARLTAAAETARCELSTARATVILVPNLAMHEARSLDLEMELTREQLETLIRPLVSLTLEPLRAALADAQVPSSAIAEVLLVGGASRTPLVRTMVAEVLGREPRHGVHPDHAVALGAAIQAAIKMGAVSSHHGIMITDVAPFTLGVEAQTSAGRQRVNGVFSPIIPRNCTIPVSRTEVYSTTYDSQRQVDIKVFQGESRLVRNNTFLDQYTVDGIPAAPAGAEKIAVTFTYDLNGILKVTTQIVSTGKEADLLVDRSPQRLSEADRVTARERLTREWGERTSPLTSAVARMAPLPSTPSGSSATAPDPETVELLAVARARLPNLTADVRGRIAGLIDRLESALSRGDSAAAADLDRVLTDALFDLGE
jgi:molecular chaperone DnaK